MWFAIMIDDDVERGMEDEEVNNDDVDCEPDVEPDGEHDAAAALNDIG